MDTKKNFARMFRPVSVLLGLACIGYFLYFHRLGNLTPGYSSPEAATFAASSNWHNIAHNPVDAPYKALVWVLTAVMHHGFMAIRILSAAFGLFAVLIFFTIIRRFFNFRIAALGTILFATSAGLLHVARLGTPQILEMGVLLFMGSILWYRHTERPKALIGYLVVLLFAVLCYIPAMVWFELLGFALLRRNISRRLRETSAMHVVGYSVLILIILVPLIFASTHDKQVFLNVAGLPSHLHDLNHFGSNLLHGLLAIGVRGNGNPILWVGHAPLLNIIELTLTAMGIYYYAYRERSARTVFMLGGIIIALILTGFGTLTGYAALIPMLYIFVACGLNHLLTEWLKVFPRNPFARFIGTGLVIVMLFFSVLYQVRSYFVAWPHNTNTEHVFSIRPPS